MQPATQPQPSVSPEGLDLDHYHPLVRAIKNVLSTDLAEVTFAQLIDGLPLVSTVWDMRGSLLRNGHPLYSHDQLCAGAIEQARMYRDEFDPAILRLDARTMQHYQNAAPGSREFNMRLVELVAATIHQIAVFLFDAEDKLHSKEEIDAVVSWKKESQWIELEPGGRRIFQEYRDPRPTLFYHSSYLDHDQYPHSLADVAGYWAEDRILGGIAVFDRGESGYECRDIYFHSGRQGTTFRIWKLLDSQFGDMIDFLLAENPSASPFPILASQHNRDRHDPWDAIALHHIFRDRWERKFPSVKPEGRDVRSVTDYPELEELFEKVDADAQASPETAYDWTASMEQEAFPWMPAANRGHGQCSDELPAQSFMDMEATGGETQTRRSSVDTFQDAESLRCNRSPPRTPPPPSPILASARLDTTNGSCTADEARRTGHTPGKDSPK
ncbi:hypothetical protein VTK26DRAFT_8322 [Humicola hyalothermophila]